MGLNNNGIEMRVPGDGVTAARSEGRPQCTALVS